MKSVEVDEEVWTELQKRAEPLVDTANDVMRQVLGLSRKRTVETPARTSTSRRRNGRVNGTPEMAFRLPILRALVEIGGRASRAQVLAKVEEIVWDRLKPVDRELLASGADIRWRNTASFQRKHMLDVDLLKRGSPNGIWEITDTGREYLRRAGENPNSTGAYTAVGAR